MKKVINNEYKCCSRMGIRLNSGKAISVGVISICVVFTAEIWRVRSLIHALPMTEPPSDVGENV